MTPWLTADGARYRIWDGLSGTQLQNGFVAGAAR
jgi:hypothetical protein